MEAHEHLAFLLRMKARAKECRSRRRRVRYSNRMKTLALDFLAEVEDAGGTLEDAAELMSMHRATLEGWVDRATTPGTTWPINVDVRVSVG
jgi:hypothetical protein